MDAKSNRKNTTDNTGLPRARARFLAQAIQLEEEGVSDILKVAIYTIMGLLIAIIVWMSLTRISEVTVTNGKVVPMGYMHNIQHLEGGIVKDILVRDGDHVTKGDLLVQFSPPASQSDLDQLNMRWATLKFDLARLTALRGSTDPLFSEKLQEYPVLLAEEEETIRIQLSSYQSELRVIDTRIKQRESELQRQKNQVTELEKETALLQKQVDIRNILADKNAISETDLLSVRSQHASLQSNLMSVKDGVYVALLALEEERKRRDEVLARHSREMEEEASGVSSQLADIESALIKARDKVDRLNLYAPVTGIVQGLAVTTINAVVRPGEVIMVVVPVDDEMIVESRLLPNEVGYVHSGQIADVKVHSYDSSRFGTLKGTVRQISPSTYLDEQANPYYKVKVELDKAWLGSRKGEMAVIPGMTVQVDIITGSKTIMEYLMKPVTRGFQTAFQQR
ncbi:MAG: adhesin transport system membrane fusion protein [Halioglobus sp.]|jgi:HlyD family type I secretion membrane fusion protein